MPEESNPNNNAAKIWKGYFRDAREAMKKGRFSEVINPIASGVILLSGILVSAVDFIIIQQMIYHFDLISLVGFIFLLAGLGLRAQTTRTLGRYFSPAVRILPEHKLIRHGIYKYIRHPIYLGTLLAYFSIPLLFHSLYGFFVMILKIPLTIYRIKIEEQVLLEKFGDEYRDYMKNSKKLIPHVY
ncbi:MAG: isoprenylcysteine carboxylmethyltransferase family protein [Candidatus Bathyarchaeia archaeon]